MTLQADVKRLTHKLEKIKAREVPLAQASALNKSRQRVTTRSIRGTAARANIKQKAIRSRLKFEKATPKRQRATIRFYVKPVSAISLFTAGRLRSVKDGKGTNRRGVRVAGRQIDGGFIAKGVGGKRHVMKREGKQRLPVDVQAFPIRHEAQAVFYKVARRVMKNEYSRLLVADLKFRIRKYSV